MNHARAVLVVSVLAACIGCDHASKLAATHLLPAEGISLLSNVLRFDLVYNPGAFLGIGTGLPKLARMLILGAVVPLGLFAAIFWMLRSGAASRLQLVAIGAIVGGGLGNWIDRLVHDGRVTDFVSVGIGALRTGIFNFADVAVVGGLLLLIAATRAAERNEDAATNA